MSAGRPTATSPANAALKSSVKVMFVTVCDASKLVTVKSSVTVSPGKAEL